MGDLPAFVAESNEIEGITREPTSQESEATQAFIHLPRLLTEDVQRLVVVYQPTATLRSKPGANVRVGSHFPPAGGPAVVVALDDLLELVSERRLTPYEAHCRYEQLHLFTDGNGWLGRAIWLWMTQDARLGFLHAFYYQTLGAYRGAR